MNGAPGWSIEEDERLRAMARSGISLAEIADLMQRSKSSVRARATRLTIALARDRNPQKTSPKASGRGRLKVGMGES
jgi:hypothetical protein